MSKINYQNLKNQAVNEVAETEEVVAEVMPVEPEVEQPAYGVVTGCTKLNVRKEPSTYGTIVCTIDEETEVSIDKEESTEAYYKVCLASGIEGFCMKQYIELRH